jgi:hypothetical protein
MIRAAAVAALAFAAAAALADDPKPVAQTAPGTTGTEASPGSPVDTAVAFMSGLTHCSRPGAAGAQAWAQVAANASDKLTLKVGGKDVAIDLANKKSDAKVVKFAKASTVRDGATVKGVAFDTVEVKNGADDHTGKGTLSMEQKDGKWVVTSLEVD